MDERDLLEQYTASASQDAFAQIVRDNIDLVYSAARRQIADPGLAEDVTQAVFIILAKKAGSIRGTVGGWLVRTTYLACKDARRMAARRDFHERRAMRTEVQTPTEPAPWEVFSPLIDEALAQLSSSDRDIITLRYLKNFSLREVAAAQKTTEEAARKRVDRAIGRLRALLAQKSAAPNSAALGSLLLANMIHPAPATLAGTTLAGSFAATATPALLAQSVSSLLTWLKLKTALTVILTAAIVAGGAALLREIAATREAAPMAASSGGGVTKPAGPAVLEGLPILSIKVDSQDQAVVLQVMSHVASKSGDRYFRDGLDKDVKAVTETGRFATIQAEVTPVENADRTLRGVNVRFIVEALAKGPDPASTISGIVVDERDNPVPNIQVRHQFQREHYTATTKGDGTFTMTVATDISRLRDYIAFTPDNARMGFATFNPPADDTGPKTVRIVLRPAREFSTTTLDVNNRPISGVLVAASAYFTQVGESTTDARGQAILRVPSDAPLGAVLATKGDAGTDYFLFWQKDSIRNNPYCLDPAFPGPFNFILNGSKTAVVQVADDQKKPVPDALVTPWYFKLPKKGGDLNIGLDAFYRTTDANGRATFDFIPAGQTNPVQFWVTKDGYDSLDRWSFKLDSTAPLVASLVRNVSMTGRVLDESGSPVAAASVHITGAGRNERDFTQIITTKSDGSFSLEVAADLYYLIQAQAAHSLSPVTGRIILRNAPNPITLRLEPGHRVFGKITAGAENTTVTAADLLFTLEDDSYYDIPVTERLPNSTESSVSIDPAISRYIKVSPKDGTFEAYLSPGKYHASSYANGDAVAESFTIGRQPEKELTLHFALAPNVPREFHGRTVLASDPNSGLPDVEIETAYVEIPRHNLRSPWGTSGPQGNFRLNRGLDDFYLSARTPDHKLGVMQVVKATDDNISVSLKPTGSVKGRIIDADGKAAAGIKLTWGIPITWTSPPQPGGIVDAGAGQTFANIFGGQTTTAADGSFACDGLFVGQNYAISTLIRIPTPVPVPDFSTEEVIHTLASMTLETATARDLGDIRMVPPSTVAHPTQPAQLP